MWELYGGVADHHDGVSLLTAGRQYAVRYPLFVTELSHELLLPEPHSVESLLGPESVRSAGARERSIKAGTLTPFILGTGLLREVAITNANPARLFDGLTFTLNRAEWDPDTRKLACLKFSCGRYFDMLDTCDCMETELLDFLVREEETRAAKVSSDTILRHLDLRRRYHELFLRLHPEHNGETGALLFDGDGRSAAVAIATMVIFEHNHDVCFFLGKRSDLGVAIQAGLTHLIPGGQFQPEWTAANVYQALKKHDGHVADEDAEFEAAIRDEFSITEHVLRESVEELFNFNPTTEPQFQPGTHDPQWYKATEPGEELVRMMDDGRAELAVTGVVWNPLNTRAEICTVLRIKDPEWFTRNDDNDMLKINDEWVPAKQTTQSAKSHAWFVRLSEFRSRISTLDYEDYLLSPEHDYRKFISPEQIVPVGAGAFWLGIRWLREHASAP